MRARLVRVAAARRVPHEIEYIDLRFRPSGWLAAAESEEIGHDYEKRGDFRRRVLTALAGTIGKSRTGSTIVISVRNQKSRRQRTRQQDVFGDKRVRQAISMALLDNAVCNELGNAASGRSCGLTATVGPVHPGAWTVCGPVAIRSARCVELLTEAGMPGLRVRVALDPTMDWRRNTNRLCGKLSAARCRFQRENDHPAGLDVLEPVDGIRVLLDQLENHRPLGTQVLVAYKSGVAWNEFALQNCRVRHAADSSQLHLGRECAPRCHEQESSHSSSDESVTIQP